MNWSENDRARIEAHQHTRIRSEMGETDIALYFDLERKLQIVTNHPAQVDRLTKNTGKLQRKVWEVSGCESINLWFAQELVWSCESETEIAFAPEDLELMQFNSQESGSMATAVAQMAAEAMKEVLPGIVGEIVAEEKQAMQQEDVKAQFLEVLRGDEIRNAIRNEVRSQLQSPANTTNGTSTATTIEPVTEPAEPATKRQSKTATTKTATKRKPPAKRQPKTA